MKRIIVVIGLILSLSVAAQRSKKVSIEFTVVDDLNLRPLIGVLVVEDSLRLQLKTNHNGRLSFRLPINSSYQFGFYKDAYEYVSKEVILGELPVVIDTIVLKGNPIELDLNLQFESSLESYFDGVDDSRSDYLNLGRDVFDRKSAFDWGSSFFNRRGLRSDYRTVLINGIRMNRLQNGRALWGQWGGLNDFFRNQQLNQPLESSAFDFSKGLGITSIDLNPFLMRKAKRLSSSISDKSYQGRLMFSIVDHISESLRYALGGSVRLGKRGYKQGTPYEAYSFAVHLAKKWNEQQHTSLHFFASNQKGGKSSALSEEEVELLGRDYNPNWGFMKGIIRSSKLSLLEYKTLLLSHKRQTLKSQFQMSLMAQQGSTSRTRLHYDQSESPNPIYYKKLPSYYINSFLGANFYAAQTAELALKSNPQLDWKKFYTANMLNPNFAHYALVADVENHKRWALFLGYQQELLKGVSLNLSFNSTNELYQQYARAEDLLGGVFIRDLNPFDHSLNDIEGSVFKGEGDHIQYAYNTKARRHKAQTSIHYKSNRWLLSLGYQLDDIYYARDRVFINQRFKETPKVHQKHFRGDHFYLSGRYAFDARNFIEFNKSSFKTPLNLNQYFVNPRENNRAVEDQFSFETADLLDLSYVIRWRKLEGRLSVFNYRINHGSSSNSYYANTSYGSVFVRSITSDQLSTHKGFEGSFKLELSPVLSLEAAVAIGNYSYANDPVLELELNDDIGIEGVSVTDLRIDLGKTKLNGYRLESGPQEAYSLSVSYRDPKYWFTSISFNRIGNNYIVPSALRLTDSFLLEKEAYTAAELAPYELDIIQAQERLKPHYITNLLFGKSYLKNGIYSSLFLSIDNLLNSEFRSGGYESSRFGNYQDYLDDQRSRTPLFPTKYWWSSSRRFFLNLTISLP